MVVKSFVLINLLVKFSHLMKLLNKLNNTNLKWFILSMQKPLLVYFRMLRYFKTNLLFFKTKWLSISPSGADPCVRPSNIWLIL